MPTIVIHGCWSVPILNRWPIGSRSGQYFFAIASLTTATTGAFSLSSSVKTRPRTSFTPMLSKYPGVTTCQSPLGFSPGPAGRYFS